MITHEELLDRISTIPEPCLTRTEAAAILAEVFRELMTEAHELDDDYLQGDLKEWLRNSILVPPKVP